MKDVSQGVKNAIATYFGIPPDTVTETRTLEDLDMDSLDIVEMWMDIEEKYGLLDRFTDEEQDKCKTVEDVVKLVQSKVSS